MDTTFLTRLADKLHLKKSTPCVFLLLMLLYGAGPTKSAPVHCPQFCYCFDTFATCSDFSYLDLTMLPPTTETLVLTKGEVEEIPPAFLATARHLKILELISVNARIVRGSAFRGLDSLQMLTITGSSFDIVEPDSFSGLHDIDKFHITDSKMGRLGKHAFGNISNIEELHLGSNSFNDFSKEAFYGLRNVETLKIIRNNISIMGADLFREAGNIHSASIYQNKIEIMNPGSMDTLAGVTEILDFSSNVFRCTCELAWVLEKPVLDEFLGDNECVFSAKSSMVVTDNAFTLDAVSRSVLCQREALENEKRRLSEETGPIVADDFWSAGAVDQSYHTLSNNFETDQYDPDKGDSTGVKVDTEESSWQSPLAPNFEEFDIYEDFNFDSPFLTHEYDKPEDKPIDEETGVNREKLPESSIYGEYTGETLPTSASVTRYEETPLMWPTPDQETWYSEEIMSSGEDLHPREEFPSLEDIFVEGTPYTETQRPHVDLYGSRPKVEMGILDRDDYERDWVTPSMDHTDDFWYQPTTKPDDSVARGSSYYDVTTKRAEVDRDTHGMDHTNDFWYQPTTKPDDSVARRSSIYDVTTKRAEVDRDTQSETVSRFHDVATPREAEPDSDVGLATLFPETEEPPTIMPIVESFDLDFGNIHVFDNGPETTEDNTFEWQYSTAEPRDQHSQRSSVTTRSTELTVRTMDSNRDIQIYVGTSATESSSQPHPEFSAGDEQNESGHGGHAERLNYVEEENNASSTLVPKLVLLVVCVLADSIARF